MYIMTSEEIRKRYLDFFEARGHVVIPSASLVPEGDSSTLFISAGMQPLVPYLLGEKHPSGKRLVNIQKCVRTGDIEEVGDASHLTFFEMLGNWSLGDYFKDEAIPWTYEYLTDEKVGLGLDKNRFYMTVFEGDDPSTPESLRTGAPKDEESKKIWMSLGVPEERIYFMSEKENWWGLGDNGPCGPDTEIFYDVTKDGLGDMSKEEFIDAEKNGQVVEVGNDVFIEYEKKDGKIVKKLENPNVDFGGGFERQVMVVQGKDSVFETDLFTPFMNKIQELTKVQKSNVGHSNILQNVRMSDDVKDGQNNQVKAQRVIADHIRTAVFMIADGVVPSNTDRGYVLRRIIRRAVRHGEALGIHDFSDLVKVVSESYTSTYGEVSDFESIGRVIHEEADQFRKTLTRGLREFEKLPDEDISGKQAFDLYQSYGFPVEMTRDLAKESGKNVDEEGFWKEMEKHKELSRSGAEKKFKGGLADHSDETVKLHTTHHLLLAALQKVLEGGIKQRGSNITGERLRIDFNISKAYS